MVRSGASNTLAANALKSLEAYLAPIRQAKLEAERRKQLQRLTEAQRRLYPPWWSRLRAAMANCWTMSKPS